MSTARRCVLHWTAGGHSASPAELLRYHLLVEHVGGETDEPEDDGARLVEGVPVERNLRSLSGVPPAHRDPDRGYAAHTAGMNSWSIGISLCGMRDAVDRRPDLGVYPGPNPITVQQLKCLFGTTVSILALHNLEPVAEQLHTHYEAEALHGVDQVPKGPGTWKWDIEYIPHRPDLAKGECGPWIREQVRRWRDGEPVDLPEYWRASG